MRFLLCLWLFACSRTVTKPSVFEEEPVLPEDSDSDGDGYAFYEDCDDNDPNVNENAIEICDGIDNNCNGDIDEGTLSFFYIDIDGDGFGDENSMVESCDTPEGYVPIPNDCNDEDDTIYPGAPEYCDGIDSNCDGLIDENVTEALFADLDGDGFGDPDTPAEGCEGSEGLVANDLDCDDTDSNINPYSEEVCDLQDNNCDGQIDEGVQNTYYLDDDADLYGSDVSTQACEQPSGYTSVSGDCNDSNPLVNPAAVEICDNLDNDCNQIVDEGLPELTFYSDGDGDGYGDSNSNIQACMQPSGVVSNSDDCDDLNPSVYPGAVELCDGLDNNCNQQVDDGLPFQNYYSDTDGDGFGDPNVLQQACLQPSGTTVDNSDCNDNDININPGAAEICDGLDNNCNQQIDDGLNFSNYFDDDDMDGFGDPSSVLSACFQPNGTVLNGFDCDDSNIDVNPAVTEVCDGIDNDCDGTIDVAASDALPFYPDLDSDGFGSGNPIYTCVQPLGYSEFDTDCDETDIAINPSAVEICDGIDNDCNQLVDDSVVFTDYYLDGDGDGFGNANLSLSACQQPSGYSINSFDCDDSNIEVNPSAVEVCNGLDDDCDGTTDVGAADATAYYPDLDLDGFGFGVPLYECVQPSGYSEFDTDCNDFDNAINPSAVELCDGIDNDCNQLVDDVISQYYYSDLDGDGFGDSSTGVMACAQPSGTVTNADDCDDSDFDVNPSAFETCNNVDDNCDGVIDEPNSSAPLWYYDGDGDGYGGGVTANTCSPPSDFTAMDGDCDDSDFLTNPGATDTCDGYDNDCDGVVDSALDCPCNYETYDGHAYLFCESAQNWYNALNGCEAWGYSLAAVNSPAEQTWLQNRTYSFSTWAWWWIGFHDLNAPNWLEPASGWEWTSGEPVSDVFWAGGQPDNYYNEDCAHFYPNGTWNDLECTRSYYSNTPIYFICESLEP
ncbi:MAG: MopE-related protein [Myxococcota bacterium]|nr:MopE-related protein [Myxococcota bacterium]